MRVARLLIAGLLLTGCLGVVASAPAEEESPAKQQHPIQRDTKDVAGWQVHIAQQLLKDQPEATRRALELLEIQLKQIEQLVPEAAVAKLRKVPLYFSPQYDGQPPRAEFHPDAGWLRDNGRDPVMAQGVEFTNVAVFAEEVQRMPNFALHELAHAYHFLVLPDGFDNESIRIAYEEAKVGGNYDRVERWHGNGQPNTTERSYAMTNPAEYFAESTEAYFVRNDFFPFTRQQLQKFDPEMTQLLGELWGKK